MTAWLRLAYKVSKRSKHPKQRLGAVIVRGGNVLAVAANGARWGRHAEIRALAACTDAAGSTLVVSRSTGSGLSKPCLGCQAAIRQAGVARVVYSVSTDGSYLLVHQS